MRFNKKKVLALSLALCMLAIMSFSTLAWFNASSSVTNKFYVINSNEAPEDADALFSIDVWEHDDQNLDGIVDDNEKDQDGREFNNILPGVPFVKAPFVENTGKYYSQWVRLTITFPKKAVWDVLKGNQTTLAALLTGMDSNGWDLAKEEARDDTYVLVYYLNRSLAPGKEVGTFTKVTFPSELTQHDLVRIQNATNQLPVEINVMAEAVQLELGTDAKAAFAAIEGTTP